MSAETIDYTELPQEVTIVVPLGEVACRPIPAAVAQDQKPIEFPPKIVPVLTKQAPIPTVPVLTADAEPLRIVPILTPPAEPLSPEMEVSIPYEAPRRTSRLPAVIPVTPANFGAVFEIMRPRLERHIYKMTHNLDEIDDLVAETAKRAWEAITPARTIIDTSAWFYRIATNITTDWLRHQQYVNRYELQPVKRQLDSLTMVDHTPAHQDGDWYHDQLHARNTVAYVLGHLSARDVKLLVLYEHEGYSCEEVGEQLDMTYSAVKTALDRARNRARKLVHDYLNGVQSQVIRSHIRNRG